MEKTIIYDRNDIESYKDFYEKLYIDLEGKRFIDWRDEECKYLGYSADVLDEFLWYSGRDKIHFVLKNFDLDKIKQQKTFEDYKINLIIEVLQESVEKYKDFSLTIE